MKTQSIDTELQVEQVQISLLRKQSIAKKYSVVSSLSQITIQLTKRAIKRANPHMDDCQVNLLFITYLYGEDLANRVEKYINRTRNGI